MASLSLCNNAPKPSDARGLLIPDDIVKYQEYIKSNPTVFWSSYQFYITGGSSKDEVLDPETILKYLTAIPHDHFRLIRSICLDLGFHNPLNVLNDRCGLEYFDWLIGDILDRGNSELVVKVLWGFVAVRTLGINSLPAVLEDRWEHCYHGQSEFKFFLAMKDYFRNWGYNADRIKILSVVKWVYEEMWTSSQLEEFSRESERMVEEASDGTLDDMSDGTLDDLSDGTLEDMSDGTLENMSDGTLDDMSDGTLENMSDGTLDNMSDGTLDNMSDGTLGEISDDISEVRMPTNEGYEEGLRWSWFRGHSLLLDLDTPDLDMGPQDDVDVIEWTYRQPEAFEDYDNKIFKIDPTSREFIEKVLWKPESAGRMSLRWDPVWGHY